MFHALVSTHYVTSLIHINTHPAVLGIFVESTQCIVPGQALHTAGPASSPAAHGSKFNLPVNSSATLPLTLEMFRVMQLVASPYITSESPISLCASVAAVTPPGRPS